MPTYSYDPAKINQAGLDRVRFDLGDCLTEDPARECFLSDEEINAALAASKSLKHCEIRLIDSLLARFSYEVDLQADQVSFKLSQRITALEKLRARFKAELDEENLNGLAFIGKRHAPPPYFWRNMHDFQTNLP